MCIYFTPDSVSVYSNVWFDVYDHWLTTHRLYGYIMTYVITCRCGNNIKYQYDTQDPTPLAKYEHFYVSCILQLDWNKILFHHTIYKIMVKDE